MGTGRHTLHDLPPEIEEEPSEDPAAPAWFAVTRGVAFFVGGVTLLILFGEMRFPHFNANVWWLDLYPLPKPAARGFLALTAVLLVFFAFFPRSAPALRRLGAGCTLGLLGLSFWNTWRFYQQAKGAPAGSEMPIPFALHVAASLIVVVPGLFAAGWERSNFFKDFCVGMLTLATCLAGFPLAQFVCLGKTDHRGAADAVIVFADGESNGKNPNALAERVHTACALYHDGKVHKVILAGRGESSAETQGTLQKLTTSERVPQGDVLVPSGVVEMEASIAATIKVLEEQKLSKVVVAAPFFELPRIKLCCQRAGLDVHTVSVREKARFQELRPSLLREATALWLCYLQPLLM